MDMETPIKLDASQEDELSNDDTSSEVASVEIAPVDAEQIVITQARDFLGVARLPMTSALKVAAFDAMLQHPSISNIVRQFVAESTWDREALLPQWTQVRLVQEPLHGPSLTMASQISRALKDFITEREEKVVQNKDSGSSASSKAPVAGGCPRELLCPKELLTKERMDEESLKGYFDFCKNNALAEYWKMISDQVLVETDDGPRWTTKSLRSLRPDVQWENDQKGKLVILSPMTSEEVNELSFACVVIDGRLAITSKLECKCALASASEVGRQGEGRKCDGQHSSHFGCKDQRWIQFRVGPTLQEVLGAEEEKPAASQSGLDACVRVVGNVRDAILSLEAIEKLTSECEDHSAVRLLCNAVVQPTSRIPCTFLTDSKDHEKSVHHPAVAALNDEQRTCLREMRYNIEAVQGPPGTGKTTFIHAAVLNLSAKHPNGATMVACVQNQAVENLALRFESSMDTLPFVVLGSAENDRLGQCARKYTLSSQIERASSVREAQQRYNEAKKNYEASKTDRDKARSHKAWRQWEGLMEKCGLPTTISSIVLDEAGNAPDHQTPQLLARKPKFLLLVGDHRQLPPFTLTIGDHPAPSLLERIFTSLEETTTLTRQYRMHPGICDFVSSSFYDGRLVSDQSVIDRVLDPAQPWLCEGVVLDLYDKGTAEEKVGKSFWNYTETMRTLLAITHLANALPDDKTIAVISFYKAHVTNLANHVAGVPALQALVEAGRLRVLSVDASQGSEADVVILNCVRSVRMRLPFFKQNRLCVSLSRAKHLLWVIGDSAMMHRQGQNHPFRRLLTSGQATSTIAGWWQLLSEKALNMDHRRKMDKRACRQAAIRSEVSAYRRQPAGKNSAIKGPE